MNAIIAPDDWFDVSPREKTDQVQSWVKWLVIQLIGYQFYHAEAVQFLVDIAPFLDKFQFDIGWNVKIERTSNSLWELTNDSHKIKIQFFTPRDIEIISYSKKEA